MMRLLRDDPDPSGAKAQPGAAASGTARTRALPEFTSCWDSEVRVLAWLALWVSVFSFLFYFRRGEVLLYGDAVAHINIARRVFDSRTPGLLQLGTVWLPLPHLLMIPFLISDEMWRRGVGGSIPSMAAYVFGVLGMFRLMRGILSRGSEPSGAARVAAWTAAAVYGGNPNLIYMQSTAMGEALYLALFIWAVVYFAEYVRGDARALAKCGWCLAAACWTRYDGWFLAVGMVAGVVIYQVWQRRRGKIGGSSGAGAQVGQPRRLSLRDSSSHSFLSRRIAGFLLIAAAAPALWLAYNAIVYRNPLEFENGPYSAKAIEKRTQSAGAVGHPGMGNVYVAGLYFLKAAQANVADNEWLQRLWILLAAAAGLAAIPLRGKNRRTATSGNNGASDSTTPPSRWPLIFLLIPVPFYALSIAYGGVPIFIPAWWPFTHYNARYGLQLLPAFAVAVAMLAHTAVRSKQWPKMWRRAALLALFAIVVLSYGSIWRAGPVCYNEAAINMRSRVALERQVAGWLHALPPNAALLMDLGGHPGAVEQAGIPLKRTINEGNHRMWMRPADPEGLWERALANPAGFADYALAFDGDDVWRGVQGRGFKELVEIKVSGQPRAVLYRLW
ncbi:MAG TPA: hypothetical protein VKR60_16515 [Candidatus Sulfotelmatobacter sp.]|nr:hypothetical protein [Candidatus Sulfotelmatobacter sp.]